MLHRINLFDRPPKTVGKRSYPHSTFDIVRDNRQRAIAWSQAFGTPFVPKGVYRFKTHEDANSWLLQMITRAS